MKIPHQPVLLNEVAQTFANLDEGIFLDCTLGFGGHSELVLKTHPKIKLIACDCDEQALEFAKKRLEPFKDRTHFISSNFSEIFEYISCSNLRGILADIGVSSFQLDTNERGFSFHSDYLDMRMNRHNILCAFEIVNSYTKEQLAHIFKEYGELRDSHRIAQMICTVRTKKPIQSAKELFNLIGKEKVGKRKILKATLIFQALRIEVNKELHNLQIFLQKVQDLKLTNCILAIICFHSLEDRIVKQFFQKWSKNCICSTKALRCECGANHSLGQTLHKKILKANETERKENSRSSCAKMRVFYFNNNGK
ncbi:16S rRNA (cytosine(1402)-N(4))-methyltransferase RsmH [Campylobacter sp. MIT 21-1685]|uniref:16S rRNA (cytosine(1402)-N(4))-methyltransferase RsmH n=1 Tax=unclassified Campylobacter TaxID=2593542 RepID=UPI00224A55CB|nr:MULTISPECIES: 16S rRNA (cytosine(1402)-N(4))-methyltransferase RsmH [unclassified Campylobacter]MCX2682328.1 16S rRNA (cytosine(1402)-N(4))-methyltransferase RsmH [Campylobacter sp. MIT 21-1684]MCX2750608.1 16S rRNA (cytosine(1402)-N(4))-methyltransferase RsmH [Campylobacter sp. MIT 21-1682]MCX2806845.1 16S rRNA (cytosine(1402)-N(4))-methyltransferase RsmH [Campylobacter sp. MIT 21-1685]